MAKKPVGAMPKGKVNNPGPAKKPAPKTTKGNSIGCMPDRMHASVSVRKIDNGYIVSESCDGPKGYSYKERFTPDKPKIVMPSTQTKGGK